MASNPLVESTFAAARIFLAEARRQEDWALSYAMHQYHAGHVGRNARRLYKEHDRKRVDALARALDCRARAKRLRVQLERMCNEDTLPPVSQERIAP